MSTSYGLACPDHGQETGLVAQTHAGGASLAAIWRIRGPLAEVHADPAWERVISGHTWLCVDDAEAAERFVVQHRGCAVEVVSEYGDRELADDAAAGVVRVPDADDVAYRAARAVLGGVDHAPLPITDGEVRRLAEAVVDAMDGQRLLNHRHRPARLRGGL